MTISDAQATSPVPVGARVKILPDSWLMFRCFDGLEAVVLRAKAPARRFDEWTLHCRLVEPFCEWDVHNHCTVRATGVEVLAGGDGTVVPGRDYRMTLLEQALERYAKTDLSFQGYSNAPTHLAALYLRADGKHQPAVLRMVRADGRINPSRLETYFNRSKLTIDDWARYPDGFPQRLEFYQQVNWTEVAQEFEELAREMAVA